MENQENKTGFFKKLFSTLRRKYMLSILDANTLEKRFTLQLSRLNVLIVVVLISLISVVFTIFIISITSLKEYIPGFASVEQMKQAYVNNLRIDSLNRAFHARDIYYKNIRETILMGLPSEILDSNVMNNSDHDYSDVDFSYSMQDSLLRLEWEERERFDLVYSPNNQTSQGISSFIFYAPIRGRVISGFNQNKGHFGIDLNGEKDAAVKATLDGIVILASWTYETGHVIAVQHSSNLISVYKHNSVLLKREGDPVQAGDPIAIIGDSGELSSGPHLHFELWYNLRPVNPADFISF
jgi:murein DD-endopeptidase MepM/ murein hydrolase activator NlpD